MKININDNIISEQVITTVDLVGQLLVSIQITGKVPPDHVMKAAILCLAQARHDLAGEQGLDA